MSLYKGENVEDVLEELESYHYQLKARGRLRGTTDTQIVRPLFQIVEDTDGCGEAEDDICICFPYPGMPLANTIWDEITERDWLTDGIQPSIPFEVENEHRRKFFQLLDERRARRMKYGAEED